MPIKLPQSRVLMWLILILILLVDGLFFQIVIDQVKDSMTSGMFKQLKTTGIRGQDPG
jgi:hypothetical protein